MSKMRNEEQTEEEYREGLEQQEMLVDQQKEAYEEPLSADFQLRRELIRVTLKTSSRMQVVGLDAEKRPTTDKDKIVSLVISEIPTKYKELLTEDLSTAWCDPDDLEVVRLLMHCCTSIKSFGLASDLDLSDAHNMIAEIYSEMIVSSKSTGKGSETAISSISRTDAKRSYDFNKKNKGSKAKGWFGF